MWQKVSQSGERNNIFCLFIFCFSGPMLKTLDHTIRIGSTPIFLYFDLYLYSAYAAHYVYFTKYWLTHTHMNKSGKVHYVGFPFWET